jgi:hypothetical protein
MLKHLEVVHHSLSKVKRIPSFFICNHIEMLILIVGRQTYMVQVQPSVSIQDVVCRTQFYETVNLSIFVVPAPVIICT